VSAAVSWIATLIVIALVVSFVAALVSLRRVPLAQRPKTPIFDRLGREIGETENPDYHANPGEESRDGPDRLDNRDNCID
jgi:hypothetical protein